MKIPCHFTKQVKNILTSVAIGSVAFPLVSQVKQKNVILILVDDLKPTIGAYGDNVAITPGLDRLANMGMRFDLAYCNQAVCMASRYNLMLGSRSTSTGIYNFGTEFRQLYPNAVTLPQHFMNAGYHAEAMGKVFHIGHGNTNDEASWSVPHHKEKVIEYIVPESTYGQLTREEAFFTNAPKYFPNLPKNKDLPRGAAWESPDVLDEAYADGRIATKAIDRLRILNEHSDKPFFLAVGFARPHLPFCAPKKYWDLYDPSKLPMPEFEQKPEGAPDFAQKRGGEIAQFKEVPTGVDIYDVELKRKLIHGYYASVSYMDAQLNKIIDELDRLKILDNTIIVLWGDHGWHLGDHGIWTKHTNYEQANRIPLLIYAPGVATAGSSTNQLAETVDIYPTLAELAGLKKPCGPQPIDGESLVPVLKDGSKRVRDHAYHAFPRQGYLGHAVRTEQYRLVEWISMDSKGENVYELYDYLNDPMERKNIASENPKVVKKLKSLLDKLPNPRLKPGKD